MEKLLIHIDGASHGNPGLAAIGALLLDEHGNMVEEISQAIGRATNNVAEYRALIEACKAALEYSPRRAIFFTDSQLVANQINGAARVRQPHLENLNRIALDLLNRLSEWTVRHVDRTVNWHAHRLAEKAVNDNATPVMPAPVLKPRPESFYDELRTKLDLLNTSDQKKVLEFANHLLQRSKHQ